MEKGLGWVGRVACDQGVEWREGKGKTREGGEKCEFRVPLVYTVQLVSPLQPTLRHPHANEAAGARIVGGPEEWSASQ